MNRNQNISRIVQNDLEMYLLLLLKASLQIKLTAVLFEKENYHFHSLRWLTEQLNI